MSHMTWFPIGESSYPDLRGVTQRVNSERIAQQWLSLTRDFWARFHERLTPNEGARPRTRQTLLYQNYLRTGYPKAAVPFTSRHDEVTHGNAIDAGVTMANGGNRALTAEEFDWFHQQCELRGFTWTGRYFGEPWHIEGATRPEHFPPYAGITVDNAIPNEEEEDMTPQQAQQLADVARAVSALQSDVRFVKSELVGSDPKKTRLQELLIDSRQLTEGNSRLKEAVLLLRQLVAGKGK